MRRLLAAAVAALLVAPAPMAGATSGVPRQVRLSGRAGEVATFRIDRPVRVGLGGMGVTVVAPGSAAWSGVAVSRLDGADVYVHYALHDSLLCPGAQCRPEKGFQPTVATAVDKEGYALLRPGRYGIALLGEAGTPVTATLHLVGARKGAVSLRPGRAAAYTTTVFGPALGTPAGEVAGRGFARVEGKGRHVVDSLAIAFVLSQPAGIQYEICRTAGGRRDVDAHGGLPCADDDGSDALTEPEVQVAPFVEAGERAVGIAWTVGADRVRGDTGLGYEAHVAGAGGRIAGLHWAVGFAA